MAIGKGLKIGLAVLSAAGGTAMAANEVVDYIDSKNETVIVEEHNIEYQHVINEKHTYWINGVEYTEEEWNNYLSNANGNSKTLYYGAVDDYSNFTLADLDTKTIVSSTNEYNVTIDANDQYTVFAIPTEFELTAVKCDMFTIEVDELATIGGYTVYSQPDKYETWLTVTGELTYSLYLK